MASNFNFKFYRSEQSQRNSRLLSDLRISPKILSAGQRNNCYPTDRKRQLDIVFEGHLLS